MMKFYLPVILVALIAGLSTRSEGQDYGPFATSNVVDATKYATYANDFKLMLRDMTLEQVNDILFAKLTGSTTIPRATPENRVYGLAYNPDAEITVATGFYNNGLNTGNATSLLSFMYKTYAANLIQSRPRRVPERAYMSNVLIRDSTATFGGTVSGWLQRFVEVQGQSIGLDEE